ncbi:MAG TPA: DUF1648 domain-containing protein [Polyangiaceae bacterium LLY-WYZ-15_(1-7)]|nr:hypothetical protein [Myxococcales bacterium]MAT23928.1 hypothetical protein [Sandaracinus sp.]HJL02908.1 DUF1648 domain-containing protein [Polyangiaceae bacterium LLY-WYZ-15_(1-7)]HJL09850.1 DUF1648 domain-containing protein [Polyangiaceae bacterium LLY-WYZ-15_(1-7)]HJL38214.1 DUF1648 domain-containing protein [Polyangiaceae bacterium LLY-WYZ-15_(1-7)]
MTLSLHRKLVAAGGLLSASGLIGSVAVWGALPARVPIHWDAAGQPNGWAPKAFALLALPLLGALLAPLAGALVSRSGHGPRRALVHRAGATVSLLTGGFLLAVHLLALRAMLHPSATLAVGAVLALTGLLFLGLAPTMRWLEPNRWAGFRTRWSLADETNWALTHRFGAWSMGLGGLVCALAPALFAPALAAWIGLGSVLAGSLAPLGYSYLLHRARGAR